MTAAVSGTRLDYERLVIGAALADGETIGPLAEALSSYRWAAPRAEATWRAIVKLGPGAATLDGVSKHLGRNGSPGLSAVDLSNSLDDALASANSQARREQILRQLQQAALWDKTREVARGENPAQGLEELRRVLDSAQPEVSAKKSKPLTLADLFSKELPPRDWMVEDWLQRSDVALLAGYMGSGKTTLIYDLALALALGRPWAGLMQVPAKRRVLLLDEEMGEEDLRRYFHELGGDPAVVGDALQIKSQDGLEVRTDAGLNYIKRLIKEHSIDVVIMDSSQHLLAYENENDAAVITAGFKRIFILRKLGVTIIIIHHLRKPMFGEKPDLHSVRGSNAFTTQPSTVWLASLGPDGMDLRQVKRRSGPKQRVRIRMDVDPDGFSRLTAEKVEESLAASAAAQQFVLEVLENTPAGEPVHKQTIEEAARRCSPPHPARTVQRALADLVEDGTATKPKRGYYTLSPRTEHACEAPF